MKKSTNMNFLDELSSNLTCCLFSKNSISKLNFRNLDGMTKVKRNLLHFSMLVSLIFTGATSWSQITIDGNPSDWPGTLSGVVVAKTYVRDANNTNDNQFTNGSQDPDYLNEWGWVLGNTNDKGDISNAGAVLLGDKIYFFGDRTAINGDAAIGFWFFHNGGAANSDGTFSGSHTVGDLLVLSHFTKGGGVATLLVYQWNGSGLTKIGETNNAAVNTTGYSVPTYTDADSGDIWSYTPKTGSGYVTGAFFEGFVDLGDLGITDICFTNFLLETRNSQSVNASLQDFVAGEFSVKPKNPTAQGDARCGAGVVTLTASCSTGGSVVRWYEAATGGSPIATNSPYEPTVSATRNYYVACYNQELNCESDKVPVKATVYPPVTAGTGSDARYCKADTGLASVNLFALLTGEDAGGVWKDVSDATVTSPINLSAFAAGEYTFTYAVTPTEEGSECPPDSESVTVKIDPTVTAGTGSPAAYCITDKGLASVDLYALLTGEDASGVWKDAANATVTSPINMSAFVAGAYTFKYTVTPTEGSKCPPDDESVTVTINPLPAITCLVDKSADVDCGVSAKVSQDNANAAFAAWFADFATKNPGFEPVVTYVYDPVSAEQVSDKAPVVPVIGTPTLANPTSVTVTWTITDKNGCENHCSATYSQKYPCAISCNITEIQNSKCSGDNSGSFKVTAQDGTPPYIIYLYKSSDTTNPIAQSDPINTNPAGWTFSGLGKGDYVTESTDAVVLKGDGTPCTASVGEPDPVTLVISSTNVTCNGKADGTISIDSYSGTGTAVISLSKDGGAFAETSEAAIEAATFGLGKYEIKVCYPDGNGVAGVCCLTQPTTITEPTLVSIDVSGTNVTCSGNGDGKLSIDSYTGGSEPTFFLKKDAGDFVEMTQAAIEAGSYTPGTYTIRIEFPDGNNPPGYGICSSAEDKVIIEPSQVTLFISSKNVTCNGKADGKLSIDSFSGDGTATFYLKVGDGEFVSMTEAAIEAGSYGPETYYIKVSYPDGNNPPGTGTCSETKSTPITQPDAVKATDESTKATCVDGKDGTVTLTFSGGTPPYTVNFKGVDYVDATSPKMYSGLAAGTYNWTVKDANECSVPGSEDVGFIPCDNELCTYTQGAYGNSGGKYCDGITGGISTSALIAQAIDHAGGTITVGKLGKNSISITGSDVACVISKLPGGGAAKELLFGDVNICSSAIPLKNGRINNVLLSQTITLALNIHIKGPGATDLANFALQAGTLATAAPIGGCGTSDPKVRICGYCENGVWMPTVNEYTYRTFSNAVITASGGENSTIASLLDLANRALANVDGVVGKEDGATLSDISGAVASINEVFDECRIAVGWDIEKCSAPIDCSQTSGGTSITSSDSTSSAGLVKVYPNPFKDHLTFEITADVSGNASLKIYNLSGQKLFDVFNGYLEAGSTRVVEFNSPYNLDQVNLIYVYRLGDKTYSSILKANQ